ncbi:MAG: translation initiation factor IF-2 [Candidatus Omnitrophica bacterium]|nr:translation initiation factor IF-2 [Candidatus Omnitrophota bacterium]
MRVNELAKELGIPTQKLVNKIKRMKISVASAVSVLSDKDVLRIRKEIKPGAGIKPVKKPPVKQTAAAPKKKAEPKLKKAAKEIKKKPVPPQAVKKPPVEKKPKPVAAALPEVKAAAPQPQKPAVKAPAPKPVPVPAPKPVPKPEIKKEEPPEVYETAIVKSVELILPITVKDLSVKLQVKSSILIKKLIDMKVMAGLNQVLPEEVVRNVCAQLGVEIKQMPRKEEVILRPHKEDDLPGSLRSRPPVATLMGHVDHGKTSLLDVIRKSNVVDKEYGGITQHIGAYQVVVPGGKITFLDTPGHEAFTAMRKRGAHITDIVILVVAADDGVMPQTQEAIDHARAAGVPIIVAINKIDKPQANLDKVKKQLAALGLNPEDWGGKTIMVGVSAKTGEGVSSLLEMILLEAEMLELKANPARAARGVVIEAKMSKGSGPVVTLLIQNGALRKGDSVIAGRYYGKIRAMFDDHGRKIDAAAPSVPIEVLGLSGVPEAGDEFFVIEDEKKARELAALRGEEAGNKEPEASKKITLEELYSQIKEGKIKELKIILKADVQGSLEALLESFNKIESSEVQINILHAGIGAINSSDVILASASNALILGFHVKPDTQAVDIISKEGVEVRTYNVIYELIDELKLALEGLLEPRIKKVFLGKVQVKKVFSLSRSGTIAGCFVTKGKITRNSLVSLERNGQPVYEGKLSSLKRFKDDVREVQEGFECGLSLAGFNDYREGDVIEVYEEQKIARKLSD